MIVVKVGDSGETSDLLDATQYGELTK